MPDGGTTLQVTAGAVALGLTQVATMTGLPSRFAALLSLLIATAVYLALAATHDAPAVVYGLMAGLSASGLYSGVKATAKGTSNP